MPIEPTEEQLTGIGAVAGTDDDGPVVMLNLNRYRDRAAYEDAVPGGEPAEVSGREAYARYGASRSRPWTIWAGGSFGTRALSEPSSATTATDTTR